MTGAAFTGNSLGTGMVEGCRSRSVAVNALHLTAINAAADGVDDRLIRAGVAGDAGRVQANALFGSINSVASST